MTHNLINNNKYNVRIVLWSREEPLHPLCSLVSLFILLLLFLISVLSLKHNKCKTFCYVNRQGF